MAADKKYKVMSVRLPAELAERIDKKAANEGMTRQQLLAALVDLGLRDAITTDPADQKVIGPLVAIRLLRETESGNSEGWNFRHLRKAIFEHLTALVASGT